MLTRQGQNTFQPQLPSALRKVTQRRHLRHIQIWRSNSTMIEMRTAHSWAKELLNIRGLDILIKINRIRDDPLFPIHVAQWFKYGMILYEPLRYRTIVSRHFLGIISFHYGNEWDTKRISFDTHLSTVHHPYCHLIILCCYFPLLSEGLAVSNNFQCLRLIHTLQQSQ